MFDSHELAPSRTPWHLWVIGIVALLWNAMAAFDYSMTQMKNADYLSAFTPTQLEFFYSFPVWLVAAWAVAVWCGVLASILLLLRKRLAAPVFLISLIAMVITSIHNFGFSNGLEAMGGYFALVFSAIIFVVAVSLFLYARAMSQRGVLR